MLNSQKTVPVTLVGSGAGHGEGVGGGAGSSTNCIRLSVPYESGVAHLMNSLKAISSLISLQKTNKIIVTHFYQFFNGRLFVY